MATAFDRRPGRTPKTGCRLDDWVDRGGMVQKVAFPLNRQREASQSGKLGPTIT